jgi:cyclopropane fatty-acyl-phospholipid synthase-like methyltransferase
MVVDVNSNYTSPAGRDCTLAAGRFAGVNPASTVLDMGCGYGEGACTLAAEFRCRVTAVDINRENIDFGRDLAAKRGVSHLISFKTEDIRAADYAEQPFELILAEGGVLSYVSRRKGLALAARWLVPRGWFAFSDLIFLSEGVPEEVREIFEDGRYHYETEATYRTLVGQEGFDIYLISLVPPSGWDNYYAHMARRLEDEKGFFADRRIKLAFHKEIDVFYRLEGFRHVGYLFCIARKRD